MNVRTARNLTLVAVAALLTCACGSEGASGTTNSADVEATSWRLLEISGETIPADVEVTLDFDGSQITGTGGCNQYNVGATFTDGTLSIDSQMMSTLMACDGAAGEIERRYFDALPRATGFVVDDATLRLDDGGDSPLLVFAARG